MCADLTVCMPCCRWLSILYGSEQRNINKRVCCECVRTLQKADVEAGLNVQEADWEGMLGRIEKRESQKVGTASHCAGLTSVKEKGKEGGLARKTVSSVPF